jgi:hypothetical protein
MEPKKSSTGEDNPKVWHKQQEAILKRWSEIGSSYRFMHDRSFTKFNTQNFRFALPVIVISTITGTANFAQSSFPESWAAYVPLGIGFLNLSAGLLTTVAQFLRVSELLEGHRAAAIAYSKFSRNISVELSLPREDRSKGGTEFVNMCRIELDRLIEQSPNVPIGIIQQFGKKFADSTFMKPEILNISSVQVYRNDKKENADCELEEMRRSEKIRGELLLGQQKRRKSIISELMDERRVQEFQDQKVVDMKKKRKKENMTIGSVGQSMANLISKLQNADDNGECITPESSNPPSEEGSNSPQNRKDKFSPLIVKIGAPDLIGQHNIVSEVVPSEVANNVLEGIRIVSSGVSNEGEPVIGENIDIVIPDTSGNEGEPLIGENIDIVITDTSGNDL